MPEPVCCPYTIVIDSQEKHPWSFDGFECDADKQYAPLYVPTVRQSLGVGRGDYSILRWEHRIALERKSMEDLHGTVLGWNPPGQDQADESEARSRRERFKAELATLSEFEFAAVVVEGTLGQTLLYAPDTDTRDGQLNAKYLFRSIMSWMGRWPKVQWIFCDDRRLAEKTAFTLLDKFYDRNREKRTRKAK